MNKAFVDFANALKTARMHAQRITQTVFLMRNKQNLLKSSDEKKQIEQRMVQDVYFKLELGAIYSLFLEHGWSFLQFKQNTVFSLESVTEFCDTICSIADTFETAFETATSHVDAVLKIVAQAQAIDDETVYPIVHHELSDYAWDVAHQLIYHDKFWTGLLQECVSIEQKLQNIEDEPQMCLLQVVNTLYCFLNDSCKV